MRQPHRTGTAQVSRRTALAGALALLAAPAHAKDRLGPTGRLEPGGLPVWRVPSGEPGLASLAVVARPLTGEGPFPLAVIAHGTVENPAGRATFPLPVYPLLTGWLSATGFAVVSAQRPGHGETGGPYRETQGPCERPDYVRAGRMTARALAATLTYMRGQNEIPVARDRCVVVGVSAGGFGALALAADPPPGLAGVVAFAPGRGGRSYGEAGRVCAPDRLVEAARTFGRAAKRPVLILSSENDSWFPPGVSRQIAEAYGPAARFRLLPPVAPDGHMVAELPAGLPLWEADMRDSLKAWGVLR